MRFLSYCSAASYGSSPADGNHPPAPQATQAPATSVSATAAPGSTAAPQPTSAPAATPVPNAIAQPTSPPAVVKPTGTLRVGQKELGPLLGTAHLGRDVLSRIIFGARILLIVALSPWAWAAPSAWYWG